MSQELEKRFTPKKISSELLGQSYSRLGQDKKSERVLNCGSFLEFAHSISADGTISEKGKLYNANFCRDRLCPLCSWRKSYKIFAQVSQIMNIIGDKYKFLFLTLTVPNCEPSELSTTLSAMVKGFARLIRFKPFKTSVLGYFRALEITRNKNNGSYHPHFHCVLAVPLNYSGKYYIKHSEWLDMWRKAMRDNSITQVDIRLVRPKKIDSVGVDSSELLHSISSVPLGSAVAEVTKYSVKDSDYIIPDNEELTDKIVLELSEALYHRRLTAFGGVFDDAFKQLQLQDIESDNADLIHINDTIDDSLALLIVRYGWSCGVYKMIDSRLKEPLED